MIAFSSEAYYALFAEYNRAIWPAQIVALLLGLLGLIATSRPFWLSNRLIAGILVVFWVWSGLVYHWSFFSGINFVAPVLAVLFVVQALLLIWTGIVRDRIAFRFSGGLYGWAGMALAIYGLTIHAVTSYLGGHLWPALPAFGVTPSPTLLFTLGLLLMAEPRIPWHLMILPIVLCLVGAIGAWFLDVGEDLPLAVVCVVSTLLAVTKNRQSRNH